MGTKGKSGEVFVKNKYTIERAGFSDIGLLKNGKPCRTWICLDSRLSFSMVESIIKSVLIAEQYDETWLPKGNGNED